MNHEAWIVAARGIFGLYLADLNGLVDRDTRTALVMYNYHGARLAFRALQDMGWVIGPESVSFLNSHIEDIIYKPRYRDDLPPIPQNVSQSGGVITCDALGDGFTANVYKFASDLFVEIGPLDGTAHAAGTYVLVASDAGGTLGLPSSYVIVS